MCLVVLAVLSSSVHHAEAQGFPAQHQVIQIERPLYGETAGQQSSDWSLRLRVLRGTSDVNMEDWDEEI